MMMNVIASGSSGNCYLLEGEKEALVIEAGVRFNTVQRAIEYRTHKISGLLVTHEHLDHSKYIDQFVRRGIDVYANQETMAKVFMTLKAKACHKNGMFHLLKENEVEKIGKFFVQPFRVKHDVPCFGFYIIHPECGNIVFITDFSNCDYNFPGVNHWIVEANFSKFLLYNNLEKGVIPPAIVNRLVKSHSEIHNTCDFLLSQDLSDSETITLIHLSQNNSDETLFEEKVKRATGVPVQIAKPGALIFFQSKI
jgi:phosphoribosyl 1,2-cyclic phosphodiesterase